MINGFRLHDTGAAPAGSANLLDAVQQACGFVPNLHRVLAESPTALEAYSTLWKIAERTRFTPQERYIAYLAIIYENECSYEGGRMDGARQAQARGLTVGEKGSGVHVGCSEMWRPRNRADEEDWR